MKTRIMIDIETLGNQPGCVILSIGAVKFAEGQILERFYRNICPQSCEEVGLTISAETVQWWFQQSDESRMAFAGGGQVLPMALADLSTWIGQGQVEIWGNGSDFDNAVLRVAYEKCGMPVPWNYWENRCYRTVKSLYPGIQIKRSGTHHNALDDATSQAFHLMEIMRSM